MFIYIHTHTNQKVSMYIYFLRKKKTQNLPKRIKQTGTGYLVKKFVFNRNQTFEFWVSRELINYFHGTESFTSCSMLSRSGNSPYSTGSITLLTIPHYLSLSKAKWLHPSQSIFSLRSLLILTSLLMNDLYYPLIGSTYFGLSPVHHQEHHLINCITHWYVRAVRQV